LKQFQRLQKGEINRIIISAPLRGSKTTFWTIGCSVFVALTRPDTRILITGYGKEFLREKFPEIVELAHCAAAHYGIRIIDESVDSILFDNKSYIKIIGISGSLEGGGWDVIVSDDVLKDIIAAQSETQRKVLAQRFFGTLLRRKRGRRLQVWVVSARRHPSDISGIALAMNEQLDPQDKWWEITTKAIGDDGKSYWEEKWPLESLLRDKKELEELPGGAWIWQNSMQQSEINPALIKWGPEYFDPEIWYDTLPGRATKTVVYLDLAWGKNAKSGDYTAIIVGCMLQNDPNIWIEDCWLERSTPDQSVDAAEMLIRKYAPIDMFGAEDNGLQSVVITRIADRILTFMPGGCPLMRYENKMNKFVRVTSDLDDFITRRRLRFRNIPSNRRGVNELLVFGDKTVHDDFPDSLSGLVKTFRYVNSS